MTYIYNGPESALDNRYSYHWEILRTALEKTRKKWGDYEMKPAPPMSELRQTEELRHASGLLNVMYLGTTPEFEKDLVGIHIPVDKNLGGYNVFLIMEKNKDLFGNVKSLDDLRKFTYGLGYGWVDVGILRANDFNVVTGRDYEGLFSMLGAGRFTIFLRAAVEVLDEVEQHKQKIPGMHIEDHIVLYYPLPMYFWFSPTAEGKRLAARAEEGMRMMIRDGTYDQIFYKFQGEKITRLNLRNRKIYRIRNPFLGPQTPFADKRLWFDPQVPVTKSADQPQLQK